MSMLTALIYDLEEDIAFDLIVWTTLSVLGDYVLCVAESVKWYSNETQIFILFSSRARTMMFQLNDIFIHILDIQ